MQQTGLLRCKSFVKGAAKTLTITNSYALLSTVEIIWKTAKG
jgi:hypothetical protein